MPLELNSAQATILGLLHDGPLTGGEINAIAEKWINPYWNTTRSQIYRELPTLAEHGLTQPSKEYGPRLSLKYKITAAGKRAFKRWMQQDPGRDIIRNETALRIALSGALKEPEQLEEMLVSMQEHHRKQVDAIDALLAEARESATDYDRQALHFALMYHTMMVDWLGTVEVDE